MVSAIAVFRHARTHALTPTHPPYRALLRCCVLVLKPSERVCQFTNHPRLFYCPHFVSSQGSDRRTSSAQFCDSAPPPRSSVEGSTSCRFGNSESMMMMLGRMSEGGAAAAGTAVVSHVRWWWCRAGSSGVGLGIRRGARSLSTAPRCDGLVASEPSGGLLTLRRRCRRPATTTTFTTATTSTATFAATRIGAVVRLTERSDFIDKSWTRREYATMASATSFYEFKPKDSEFGLPLPLLFFFTSRIYTKKRTKQSLQFLRKIHNLLFLPHPSASPLLTHTTRHPPSKDSQALTTTPPSQTEKGQPYDLSQLSNKVVLVVNTASKCGFTPQFEGLEKLYKDIKSKYPNDFEILGFPCNQFGGQDPGTNEEIQEFCQVNYGVSFPVLGKIDVCHIYIPFFPLPLS